MTLDSITDLNPRQLHFLDWLCTPPSERVPPTQGKYALEFDVDEATLRKWKKKESFRTEWKKRVDAIQGSPERTQKLLDTLYAKALEGDVKSAQLYMQATNRMAPPTVNVNTGSKASELSDAELDELISQIAAREKDRRVLKVV